MSDEEKKGFGPAGSLWWFWCDTIHCNALTACKHADSAQIGLACAFCGCDGDRFCSSIMGHMCYYCSIPCRLPLDAAALVLGGLVDILLLTCCSCTFCPDDCCGPSASERCVGNSNWCGFSGSCSFCKASTKPANVDSCCWVTDGPQKQSWAIRSLFDCLGAFCGLSPAIARRPCCEPAEWTFVNHCCCPI